MRLRRDLYQHRRRSRHQHLHRAGVEPLEPLEPRRLLAAGGDLDLGFGFLGKAVTPHVGDVDDSGDAIALLSDGKILVGGNIWAGVNFPTLTRYLSNGAIDTSFGVGGTAKATSLAWRSILDIAVSNADGSIIAVSSTNAPQPIQRFTSSGALDPAWVGPGTSVPGRPAGVARLGDGRSYYMTQTTLARLKTDGTLDTSFGAGGTGMVTFPPPTSPDFLRYDPYAIVVEPGGGILVAGERVGITTGAKRAFVRRYTSAGALDAAWAGGTGTLLLPTSATDSAVRGMQVFGGGLIVVTGRNGLDTFAARFTPLGAMDNTFGVGGVRTIAASATSSDEARRIAVGPNNYVYLGGYVSDVGPFIARLTSSGAVDNAYDGNGVLEQPLPVGWPVFGGANIAVNIATNQVTMTTAAADTFNQTWDEVLTRYTNTGALDTTFATGGMSRIDRTHAQSVSPTVGSVMQADGKVIHFGTSQWVEGDVTLRRVNLDGSPDTSFGVAGVAEIDLGSDTEQPFAATVQSDGKIVVVGRSDRIVGPITAPTWQHEFFVARFNANGTPDTSFDTDGFNVFQYADGFWGYFNNVAVLSSGAIVAAGLFQDTAGARTGIVAKFSSTGVLDMAYGGGAGTGRKLIDLSGDAERIAAIMPYPGSFAAGGGGTNGLIVVGSVDTTTSNTDRFVARLDDNGNYITTFGAGGVLTLDASPNEGVVGVVGFDPTAGFIQVGSVVDSNLLVTRLNGNGTPSTTFGVNGTATVPLPANTVAVADMRRTNTGAFLFAGTRTPPGSSAKDAMIIRLTSAGALDNTFGVGGVATVDFGSSADVGLKVHLAPDGRIVVGGRRVIADVGEWAAARVLAEPTTPLEVLDRRVRYSPVGPTLEFTLNGDLLNSADDEDLVAFNLTTGERFDDFNLGVGGIGQPTSFAVWSRSGSLPDGMYKVVIPAGALSDSAGNARGEYTFDLFVHNGSTGVDVYSVRRFDAATVRVTYNAGGAPAAFFNVPAPAVEFGTAIVLGGGTAGDDHFTIDYAGGELPAVDVTVSGYNGNDTLSYIGQAGATFALDGAATIARIGVAGPAAATFYDGTLENFTLDTATYDFNGLVLNKNFDIRDDAIANFNVSQRLGTLAIAGQATVPAGGDKVILTRGLSITGSGWLDLTDNDLAINYAPTDPSPFGTFTPESGYSGVVGMIARAYNFSAWDQPGLRTSANLAQLGQTTLAPAEASAVLFLEPTETAMWNGVTIDGTTVLVKNTYAGDADLNGYVDAADYGVIDNYIQFPGTSGYENGDFNFDGIIDAADYGLIDNSIQLQGPAL